MWFLLSLLPLRTFLMALTFSPNGSHCFSIANQSAEITSFQAGKLCVGICPVPSRSPDAEVEAGTLTLVCMSGPRVPVCSVAISPSLLCTAHTGILLPHC